MQTKDYSSQEFMVNVFIERKRCRPTTIPVRNSWLVFWCRVMQLVVNKRVAHRKKSIFLLIQAVKFEKNVPILLCEVSLSSFLFKKLPILMSENGPTWWQMTRFVSCTITAWQWQDRWQVSCHAQWQPDSDKTDDKFRVMHNYSLTVTRQMTSFVSCTITAWQWQDRWQVSCHAQLQPDSSMMTLCAKYYLWNNFAQSWYNFPACVWLMTLSQSSMWRRSKQ